MLPEELSVLSKTMQSYKPINVLAKKETYFLDAHHDPIANRIQFRHYVHEINSQCKYLIKSFISENFFWRILISKPLVLNLFYPNGKGCTEGKTYSGYSPTYEYIFLTKLLIIVLAHLAKNVPLYLVCLFLRCPLPLN